MTTVTSVKCKACGANITTAEGCTLQDAIDFHNAMDHDGFNEYIQEEDSDKLDVHVPEPVATPKAKALTKAQRKAANDAAVQEVGIPLDVPVVDKPKAKPVYTCTYKCGYSSEYKVAVLSHEKACDLAGKPFPVRKEEKAPVAQKSEMPVIEEISLATLRESLISMNTAIQAAVQDTVEQAESDAAFFKEIQETEMLIHTLREETLPALQTIKPPYRNDQLIDTMEKKLADAIGHVAIMKTDPRYSRGKHGADQVALAKALRNAQTKAAQHNAEIGDQAIKDAQEWMDKETTRFQRMLYGEIYVPRRGNEAISFMHDTMWRLASELKLARGDKWYKDLKPVDIREVWNKVFAYQMERYEFEKSREFVYMGKRATVDEMGAINLGKTEEFKHMAELPFETWSNHLLNIAIDVQRENRGNNLLTILTRLGYQGKDGVQAEVLGARHLNYATEKDAGPATEMAAAWETAQKNAKGK